MHIEAIVRRRILFFPPKRSARDLPSILLEEDNSNVHISILIMWSFHVLVCSVNYCASVVVCEPYILL